MGNVKLLKASAGSGKTYRLAYEYVRGVVAEPFMYRHTLAVTFTNKATEEMKRRILSEINDLANGRGTKYMGMLIRDLGFSAEEISRRAAQARSKILHDYSQFSVLTIDKFFQRIIRAFVKELGIDLNFNLELRTDTLLSSAADSLIDEISFNDKLRQWITGFIQERIAENKQWSIKEGLTELGSELFGEQYKRSSPLLASREKLEKIVSEYSSRAFAALEAMKVRGAEAIGIMQRHGLDVADFAYGKSGFANYFVKIASGNIEEPVGRVQAALGSDEQWYSKNSAKKAAIIATIPELRPLLERICDDYEKNIAMFNTAELLRENFRNFAMLTDLSRKIEEKCTTEGIMPISETNAILNKLVSGNDTPFIFEKAGNHFSRFMIDEFQDTSAMQWENFIPLLRNSLAQSPGEPVLLVGDVKQSIYRWRGGDWRILAREIEAEFGKVEIENMATNYRSLGNVVRFNNELIQACVDIDNDALNAELDEAVEKRTLEPAHAGRLRDMLRNAYDGHRQNVPSRNDEGYVNVTYYSGESSTEYAQTSGVTNAAKPYSQTDRQEGKQSEPKAVPPVIERIEELQERGYAPSDIAILVRYNAEGMKVANMLLEHKKRNPGSRYSYDVVTQEALMINSSPAISFVCACLKLACTPDDRLNTALYNQWFGREFGIAPDKEESEFLATLRTLPPLEAFEHIVMRYDLGAKPEHATYLQAFEEQMIDFGKSTVADIPLFLKWWDENGSTQSVGMSDTGQAITIITIHKAKGLQYKAVIIPYCDWKLTPNSKTVLWSHGQGENISEAGVIPVKYKSKMKRSAFANDYFDELVLSHVDNINTLYVAATRAEEELHIMLPDPGKSPSDKVGSLLEQSIVLTDARAKIGGMDGSVKLSGYGKVIEFGTPLSPRPTDSNSNTQTINVPFKSAGIAERLRIKYRASRYLEDGATLSLTPRDYGILMHKVFESARSKEDIQHIIDGLVANGDIQEHESIQLSGMLADAFRNPVIESWFSGEWDVIRNENAIIVPRDPGMRRPDRVMIKGDTAIVVDYKFGLERQGPHTKQVRHYMNLLKEMGYAHTEGYIWYVSSGHVESIG